MATLTRGTTYGATETITNTKLHILVDNGSVSGIVNSDISATAAIVDTKLATISTAGKVQGTSLDLLANIPSGAGEIPSINLLAIAKTIYPIGSLYISTLSTNPNTLLGFGTWTTFGAGRVMVGLNSGDTDFDTVEETGGEKTHTLSETEMPSHRHSMTTHAGTSAIGTISNNDQNIGNYTAYTDYTGGGLAHNNLQPYIVVYMWKRTA